MHAVIKIIFYIDHIKNADNWDAAILDMQIGKCNVISGYVGFYLGFFLVKRQLSKRDVNNKLSLRSVWIYHAYLKLLYGQTTTQ
jgi:hypothetical protein